MRLGDSSLHIRQIIGAAAAQQLVDDASDLGGVLARFPIDATDAVANGKMLKQLVVMQRPLTSGGRIEEEILWRGGLSRMRTIDVASSLQLVDLPQPLDPGMIDDIFFRNVVVGRIGEWNVAVARIVGQAGGIDAHTAVLEKIAVWAPNRTSIIFDGPNSLYWPCFWRHRGWRS